MIDPLDKLKQLFTPKIESESFYLYSNIVTHYPGHIKVYQPHKPGRKLFAGLQALPQIAKISRAYNHADKSEDDSSLRRTRRKIKDYILCNGFELWVTFTFDPDKVNRQDPDKCKTKMADWLKNQQKRNGKFAYLIVPEFHKDNQSLHFHALLKNYPGKVSKSINEATGSQRTQKGQKVYTLPRYTLGFTNVKIIDQSPESQSRLGSYISKYITKEMPLFFGKKRYWCSKGLLTPRVEYDAQIVFDDIEPDWSHESEFGITKIYSLEKLKDLKQI
jgi:hypothetical protein